MVLSRSSAPQVMDAAGGRVRMADEADPDGAGYAGPSLALPRDGARLPVVVNLAAAAAAYLWLLTGLARRHAAKAEA